MSRESTETRRLSDKEVINGLISHIEFLLFAADDPKSFGVWIEKNPQYSLSINLLNRLIEQRLKSHENLGEFLSAIQLGRRNITQYLVSHPELFNTLKEFLAPVLVAADQWKLEALNKPQVLAESRNNLDQMINDHKVETQNRALALANILHLRALFPGKDTVDFNQFIHLFFSDAVPDRTTLHGGIRVLYDLINNNLDKSLEVFRMIATANLMLYSSYSRIGSGMTLNEEEFSHRHKLLQALQEISDGDVSTEYTINVTDSLNDLNDYISTDQNYSNLQDQLYPKINAIKLLKKLLENGETRKEFVEKRALLIENLLSDVVLNEDSAENIIKITHVYREVSNLCQLDRYSIIQEVLKMQSLLKLTLQDRELREGDTDEKAVQQLLIQYDLIDDKYKIRNLGDLLRVHQLFNVLSNNEIIRELLKNKTELLDLEEAIKADVNLLPNNPVIHEITFILDTFNQYRSSFIDASVCYSNISSQIDEDILSKNLVIYQKLLTLSEQFQNGLRLEHFKYSEIPQDEVKQSIDKLNYYLVLIRSDLFNKNDYKALFSVKTSHQSLLEKFTTPQASQLAYFIERCDVDDKQINLIELVKAAYEKPMKTHFHFVFKNMADKNVVEYIEELKGLGNNSEIERFCRKIEKAVPGYFKSDKLYDTDVSVRDFEHRMPIQSYATPQKSSEDKQQTIVSDQKDFPENNELKK